AFIMDTIIEIRTELTRGADKILPRRADESKKLWGVPDFHYRLSFKVSKEVLCIKGHLFAQYSASIRCDPKRSSACRTTCSGLPFFSPLFLALRTRGSILYCISFYYQVRPALLCSFQEI